MSRSIAAKDETFTFRLDETLKRELSRAAADAHVQPGELVRALVRRHLDHEARKTFEAEAHRQAVMVAEQSADFERDDAEIMRELGTYLDSGAFGDAWKP
jgi:Arc/MetJ-type ribon-helix-helix transcriptional regulator